MIGKGYPDRYLSEEETGSIVEESLQTLPLDGKRVLVIIPDGTRSMPMPLMFDSIRAVSGPAGQGIGFSGRAGHPSADG